MGNYIGVNTANVIIHPCHNLSYSLLVIGTLRMWLFGFVLVYVIWLKWISAQYSDVIMSAMASQITGVSIVCWVVCSRADQSKHQSFTSLAFVRGIHRWPVDSPHKGPVTRGMFLFDDVIMNYFPYSSDSFYLLWIDLSIPSVPVRKDKNYNEIQERIDKRSWFFSCEPMCGITSQLIGLSLDWIVDSRCHVD